MTDLELVALATEIRDEVWRGRDASELPDSEVEMAIATRELWQELTLRFVNPDG